jgi:AAA15 family ATPase/GTPase
LEPTNTKEKIIDFTIYVAESIGVTKESEIATEFELLTEKGMHPFLLSLVALHVTLCTTLDYDPEEKLSEQEPLQPFNREDAARQVGRRL